MNRKLSLVLWTLLSAIILTVTAAAQSSPSNQTPAVPRIVYATFYPGHSAVQLRYVDWDDRHRCDGDHDRDDRHCHWGDRDGGYYYRGNGYVGSGYAYGSSYGAYYGPHGWYDKHGRWHTEYGWYDKHGKWHKAKDHDDR
jgi:hypothetical protein